MQYGVLNFCGSGQQGSTGSGIFYCAIDSLKLSVLLDRMM